MDPIEQPKPKQGEVTYPSITPMLGEAVSHKKTKKEYYMGPSTQKRNGVPGVLLFSPGGKSRFAAIEQVIRDYELCRREKGAK